MSQPTPEQIKSASERLSAGQSKIQIPSIEVPDTSPITSVSAGEKSIATVMGEIVWLLTQSPAHRYLTLGDLEWMLMPPVLLGQYKIFRNEDQVVGAALWAYLNEEAEERLKATSRLAPQDWGNGASVSIDEGIIANEGGKLWLIEILAPFNSVENSHQQQMLADLMLNNLKGQEIHTFRIDPETGLKEEAVVR